MNDIFYWMGIVFIIEAIRGSIMAKKEISEYQSDIKMPGKIDNQEDAKDAIKMMLGDLKTKALPSLMGLFILVWNIIGIFYTNEWMWFVVNISAIFIYSLMVGFNHKLRNVSLSVAFNVLSISIMSYILYSHFK